MHRVLVIARHTLIEAVSQPIFAMMLIFAGAAVVVLSRLAFVTLGHDTVMYKLVGLDVVILAALLAALFTASRSVFEEIEDRTVLTLLSKPVGRWQVLVGKYLGLIAASLILVIALGGLLIVCTLWRIPGDYMLNPASVNDLELARIHDLRWSHATGLVPSLLLAWMQVAALTAVSVAVSTRFGLVVNLPVVLMIYFAGNLTRFLGDAAEGAGWLVGLLVQVLATALPFLEVFDFRGRTIYEHVAVPGTRFATDPALAGLDDIAQYLALAGIYGALYATLALLVGVILMQNRDLGGAEG